MVVLLGTTIIEKRTMTGRRLITQNMLAAAAQIESGKHISWSDIRDFVALADLFCLYDQVEIIGRQAYSF